TSVIEHRAVLDSSKRLEGEGFEVTYLPAGTEGLISPDLLKRALTDRTVLISVMAANNETGVLEPIAKIGQVCRERGVLFHTDAAQAAGKVPLDVQAMYLDL